MDKKSVNNIFFSVIIPVYQREEIVLRAIQSVIKQNYPYDSFECVVIDDGSPTPHPLLGKNNRDFTDFPQEFQFIYRHYSKNQGVSWARNAGLHHAKGEWIAFLDSDDEWLPDKLSAAAKFINEQPDFYVFQTDEEWIRKGKKVNFPEHLKKISGDIFMPSLERCLVTTSSVVVHRELLMTHPWDENLRCCEDYDLWIRLAHKYVFGFLPIKLTIRYQDYGGEQLSLTSPVMDGYRIQALKKIITKILTELRAEEKLAYAELDTKKKINFALAVLKQKSDIVLLGMCKRKFFFRWFKILVIYKLWGWWTSLVLNK